MEFPKYIPIDSHAGEIHLEVPSEKVVLMQAFFELSEGLGAVRTTDVRNSKVLVMLSKDSYKDACGLLASIQKIVQWRAA